MVSLVLNLAAVVSFLARDYFKYKHSIHGKQAFSMAGISKVK